MNAVNAVLNPDRTRKCIIAVAYDVWALNNPQADLVNDIFVEDVPPIPEGMNTPRLSIDGTVWVEGNQAAYDAELAAQNIAAIKAKAYSIIVARIPEWKQRNMLARKTELQDKILSSQALSAEEQAEWDFMTAEWEWCKSVRLASDAAEIANTPVNDIVWP